MKLHDIKSRWKRKDSIWFHEVENKLNVLSEICVTELMILQRRNKGSTHRRTKVWCFYSTELEITNKKNLFSCYWTGYGFCVSFSTKYNRNTKNRIKWATISNTMKTMQNIILLRYNCLLNWFQLNGYEENASMYVCVCVCAVIVLWIRHQCVLRSHNGR